MTRLKSKNSPLPAAAAASQLPQQLALKRSTIVRNGHKNNKNFLIALFWVWFSIFSSLLYFDFIIQFDSDDDLYVHIPSIDIISIERVNWTLKELE